MKASVSHILLSFMCSAWMICMVGCGSGERDFILQSLPERPNLDGFPDRLHQRIENAELQALSGNDPVGGLADLARVYHANGLYEEASVCYQALSVCDPGEGRWPHLLAEILSSYGQLNDALPWRQKAVELAPEYVPALVRLGDVYLKQNALAEAESIYNRALKAEPDNPYGLVGLARLDVIKGDLAQARTRLENAIKVSDLRIGADLLATVYQELGLGRRAEAIRGLNKGSGSFSDIPDPWVAELYAESFDTFQIAVAAGMAEKGGDISAAIRLLKRALQLSPKDAMLHFQLGLIYRGRGETRLAVESFTACTEFDPKFADGWFHLAGIHTEAGNVEAENRVLATGLFHNPNSPGLHLSNGARLKRTGQYQAAIREVEKAIELRPEEANPYVELATLHIIESRYAVGIQLLNEALAIESLHPLALSTMAIFYISEGKEVEARQTIRKVEMQPRISAEDRVELVSKFTQRFGKAP